MYQENPALQTRTRSGLRPTSDMLLPGSPFQPFPLSSVLPQRKHPLRQSDSPAERGDTSGCRERGDPNRAEPNRPELERKRREAGGEAAAARAPVTQVPHPFFSRVPRRGDRKCPGDPDCPIRGL
ncbi:Hypothetical predicted protein [Xyrichtys novacula]|uniref:Uncharacterized protein n=1 Tax=Xyrichtys novacula TaxID=13765 RepID=A0AAV1F080_XYRNO|nr:Hypothetical predicted protein [Xyrichtys novacula]